ncbi:MAG: hypothetical protein JEZ06_03835 [Anaerolineaceae bacterium]|nr:hypothetical protein [Anaerolineaceae bacterium]
MAYISLFLFIFISILSHLIITVKNTTERQNLKKNIKKQSFTKQDITKDLSFLIDRFECIHSQPFHQHMKEKFLTECEKIVSSISDPVSRQTFLLELAPLLKLFKAAQTELAPENHKEPFNHQKVSENTFLLTIRNFQGSKNQFSLFLNEFFTTLKNQEFQNLIIDLSQTTRGNVSISNLLLSYISKISFSQYRIAEFKISQESRSKRKEYFPASIRWLQLEHVHPQLRYFWVKRKGDFSIIEYKPVQIQQDNQVFEGNIFLLIGPETRTTAALFAATIKKYDLGTLIGENSGSEATQLGDFIILQLPNSGLQISIPSSQIFGNGNGPVVPDHLVKLDPIKNPGKDEILAYTNHLIKRKY